MLQVLTIDPEPVTELLHLNTAPRRGTEVWRLVVQRACVRELPTNLNTITKHPHNSFGAEARALLARFVASAGTYAADEWASS